MSKVNHRARAREGARLAAFERGDFDLLGDEFVDDMRRIDGLSPRVDFSDRAAVEASLRRSLAHLPADELDFLVARNLDALFGDDEPTPEGKAARDGDGDGFVYDGTPRQRPAPPAAFNKRWGRRSGSKKDLRDLQKELERRGWSVSKTGSGHNRAVPPNKDLPIVIYPSTSSDVRSWRNMMAQLRNSGFGTEDL